MNNDRKMHKKPKPTAKFTVEKLNKYARPDQVNPKTAIRIRSIGLWTARQSSRRRTPINRKLSVRANGIKGIICFGRIVPVNMYNPHLPLVINAGLVIDLSDAISSSMLMVTLNNSKPYVDKETITQIRSSTQCVHKKVFSLLPRILPFIKFEFIVLIVKKPLFNLGIFLG